MFEVQKPPPGPTQVKDDVPRMSMSPPAPLVPTEFAPPVAVSETVSVTSVITMMLAKLVDWSSVPPVALSKMLPASAVRLMSPPSAEKLMPVPPAPSLSDNWMFPVVAKNVKFIGATSLASLTAMPSNVTSVPPSVRPSVRPSKFVVV